MDQGGCRYIMLLMAKHDALPSGRRPVMALSSATPIARLVHVEMVDGRPFMGGLQQAPTAHRHLQPTDICSPPTSAAHRHLQPIDMYSPSGGSLRARRNCRRATFHGCLRQRRPQRARGWGWGGVGGYPRSDPVRRASDVLCLNLICRPTSEPCFEARRTAPPRIRSAEEHAPCAAPGCTSHGPEVPKFVFMAVGFANHIPRAHA